MARYFPDMSRMQLLPSQPTGRPTAPPMPNAEPGANPFLRSLAPLSVTSQPDVLRQFYQTGVPQYRTIPPLQLGVRPII